jgi:hypothetical protein
MVPAPAFYLLATAALGAAIAVSGAIQRRRLAFRAKSAAQTLATITELSDAEIDSAVHQGSLTTVNLYCGEFGKEQHAELRKRLAVVLSKNAWLNGSLAPSIRTKRPIALYTPMEIGDTPILSVVNEPGLALSMGYAELMKLVSKHAVDGGQPTGDEGRLLGPVFRMTVLTGEGGDRLKFFALVISLSHTVADGFTFYSLYRMLAGTDPVERMDIHRTPHVAPPNAERMAWARSGPMSRWSLDALLARIRPGVLVCPLLLDAEYARARKAAHVKTEAVPFTSANDVYTSDLLCVLAPDCGVVMVNPRVRLPHIASRDHAGNHPDWLVLMPDEYASATAVRTALAKRVLPMRNDMLGLLRAWRSSVAVVSSWKFGSTEFEIHGCGQLLHLPCIEGWPTRRRMVVLFTPRPGATAALVRAPDAKTAKKVSSLGLVSTHLDW